MPTATCLSVTFLSGHELSGASPRRSTASARVSGSSPAPFHVSIKASFPSCVSASAIRQRPNFHLIEILGRTILDSLATAKQRGLSPGGSLRHTLDTPTGQSRRPRFRLHSYIGSSIKFMLLLNQLPYQDIPTNYG
jgi:hypothetical protein